MNLDNATIVGIIVLILLNVAPGIQSWMEIFTGKKNRELSPQPFVVKADLELVPEKHFSEHKKSNHDDHSDLFKRVNGVEVKVAALENADASTKQRLVLMDQKLDRLLERHTS